RVVVARSVVVIVPRGWRGGRQNQIEQPLWRIGNVVRAGLNPLVAAPVCRYRAGGDDVTTLPAYVDRDAKATSIAHAVNVAEKDMRPASHRPGARGVGKLTVLSLHFCKPFVSVAYARLYIEVENP